jgi:UbiD family decarboxylase
MSLRSYLYNLAENNEIINISKEISKTYEIAGVLNKLAPSVVMFHNVRESKFKVFGNLLPSKVSVANYLGVDIRDIIPTLSRAIDNRSPPEIVESAPCQEVIVSNPDLDALPILKHSTLDGGNYISSGVFITKHPEHGQNVDFHRCMQYSKTEMSVRVVKSRHFDTFLQDMEELEVAICIGNPPNVLLAAATSVDIGIDELDIANALKPLTVTKAKTMDMFIPADAEFVLEGTAYLNKTHCEGPFTDLTGTQDIIRQEPIFVVNTITHRHDAMWHALLPGGLEHKLLMGMPREPTIFRHVNREVKCLDVNVNPGGCSWLHAIVQIDKQNHDDGMKAIHAAFAGHRSCKHVFIVDDDINIYDPLEVEWAFATRFQGDRDMIVFDKKPGSSLDPSADSETKFTTRIGFDLTKPLSSKRTSFDKVAFPDIDLSKYVVDDR